MCKGVKGLKENGKFLKSKSVREIQKWTKINVQKSKRGSISWKTPYIFPLVSIMVWVTEKITQNLLR